MVYIHSTVILPIWQATYKVILMSNNLYIWFTKYLYNIIAIFDNNPEITRKILW